MSKILIVCSKSSFHQECADMMQAEGFATHFVNSSLEALSYIKSERRPDVVILDTEIGPNECYELLETLHVHHPHLAVILTSPCAEFITNFRSWLADACVVPSPDLVNLKTTIQEVLAHRSASEK